MIIQTKKMIMIEYKNIRDVVFKLNPESAHMVAEKLLSAVGSCSFLSSQLSSRYWSITPMLEQELFGKRVLNPVGLAAGYDKDAKALRGLAALGFGFLELGTVTPKPQSGNPKPRLFRHIEAKSLQNAMGFNNDGIEAMAKRLKKSYPFSIPLGLNVGKNKTTPTHNAIEDYIECIKRAGDMCDYVVINISSPNTPNLRELFNEEFIKELFSRATQETKRDIFLKLSPDMSIDDALFICDVAYKNGAKGFIATNTTTEYDLLEGAKDFGGLSGEVLKQKSFLMFKEVAKNYFGRAILISSGGISSAEDAYLRIKHGASLVQVYTALIYEGPALIKSINEGLCELLKKDGFASISEAKGSML
ncbi:MAG: quinone-dependent dihydroorotate dehydrogenase [Campylobacterales bacterium]